MSTLETERPATPRQSLWRETWGRLVRKRVAVVVMAVIVLLYGAGLLAPWVAPYAYNQQDLGAALQGPSLQHPFGTDRLGRDLFSRIVWGLRTTVVVTIAAIFTGSLFLGIALGTLAGYLGRRVDMAIMRLGDIFLAFPGLLLIILIAATLKPRVLDWVRYVEDTTPLEGLVQSGMVDYFVIFGALALFGWVGMARLVRGQMLYLKEMPFVDAARSAGASTGRILLIHLLPNALSPVIVTVSMAMGGAAGSEVVLSWLGIGIQPPTPSLGNMIFENGNISVLRTDPHLLLFPVLVVGMIIFSFNLLGDALNDALNPRAR